MVSRLRFNPLLQKILAQQLGMGPKRLTAADDELDCFVPNYGFEAAGFVIPLGRTCPETLTEFNRGIIHTMNMVSEATVIADRPRSIADDLSLSSTGGYLADFNQSITHAMLIADAAVWRFEFLQSIDHNLPLTDQTQVQVALLRSIEDAMVLQSTVVNVTTYLRTLSDALALTDATRPGLIVESLLDLMMLDHQSGVQVEFLRALIENLGITDAGSKVIDFVQAIEHVLSVSQTDAVTADFVRSVDDILLLADDAFQGNEFLEAIESAMLLTQQSISVWDFNRTDERTMNITDSADDGYVAVCDLLDWTLIGYDYPNDAIYGKETAGFPFPTGSRGTSNTDYWVQYGQCWNTNLQTGEPPSPGYGAAGPVALVGNNKWRGGVLSEAGYVYFVPHDNAYTYKFNASNNTGANLSTSHTGTGKWAGGCLGFSGNIICAPNNATTILHINTSNDNETKFGSYIGNNKWHGAYLNKNGWAILAPRLSSSIVAVNPDSTANDVHISSGPTVPNLACGTLGPDGVSLYIAPSSSTQVLKCNTADQTNITWKWLDGGPYSGFNAYFGLVLDPTGNIYGIPYNATSVLKIETQNGDHESTFGSLIGNAKYTCGALSHDTRVYSAFWGTTNAVGIRTGNDTTFTFTTFTLGGTNETVGCVAVPDGRIIVVPADITAVPRYNTDASSSREADFLLSPYWNKL